MQVVIIRPAHSHDTPKDYNFIKMGQFIMAANVMINNTVSYVHSILMNLLPDFQCKFSLPYA